MDGWLNLQKPTGRTSHDCVYWARKKLGIEKAGHTGTLDPGASGVLCLCFGKATKFSIWAMEKDKVYKARVTLGVSTDTLDHEGTPLAWKEPSFHSEEEIRRALKSFTGAIFQTPPVYSAVKIGGKKLYKLARSGKELPEIPKRQVEIYALELLDYEAPHMTLRVHCSCGTYIRTLAQDLSAALGEEGHMSMLIRERSGAMELAKSHTMEEVEEAYKEGFLQDWVLPIDSMLQEFPAVFVQEVSEKFYRNGGTLFASEFASEEKRETLVRAYNQQYVFLGMGSLKQGDEGLVLKSKRLSLI